MSSEVRNDLQSSQEAYRQKTQEARDDHDSELSKIKEKNREAEAKERSSGEASINHIRQSTREQVDNLEQEGEQRIQRTKTSYDRRLQDMQKQRGEEQHSLRRDIEQQRESYAEMAKDNYEHRQAANEREEKRTRDVEQQQYKRRAELISKDQEQLSKMHHRLQEQKHKLEETNANDLEKTDKQYQNDLKRVRKESAESFEREKVADHERVDHERVSTDQRLEQQRHEAQAREKEIRDKTHQVLTQESDQHQQRITTLRKKNNEEFTREHERGIASTEVTRQHYADEVNRLHKEGDQEIGEQKTINEQQLALQKEQFKVEHDDRIQKFEADKKKAFEVYRTQLMHDKGFYKKSLDEQKNEFDKIYKQNSDENQNVVINAKAKAAEEVIKEKQKVMSTLGKYNDKSEDPFYRVQTVQYSLSESPEFYELTAHIPEKDKENVKVVVKNDKVVLQGQRRYEDKIDQADHKMTTQSFQTYREEVPLKHPVHEHYATRTWENGMLKLKIPKA